MGTVSILDCTLRDGGYINEWLFGEKTISKIIANLENAKIDIIECGFIRNVGRNVNSSVFSSMQQVTQVISPKKPGTLYAIMIEQHNHMADSIPQNNGFGADIIRVTFRRNEWPEAKRDIEKLIRKGYMVCVQPVGTATYDDEALLNLVKEVNQLKPYAFYLVDTLGMMYQHDTRRMFYLIDYNLRKEIRIGFHSHNNLQMSFANAQELMRMANQRDIIIDASCYGMGRGVGNLATQLIADYINNVNELRYSLTPILNIIDKYLMCFYAKQRWGYDLPYFLAATHKCHPNYATQLIRKETIGIERIERILSLIPLSFRNEYDENLIEQLYLDFQECEIQDSKAYEELAALLGAKAVLIIGSGASINQYHERIVALSQSCFTILINFYHESISPDAVFVSNSRRIESIESPKVNRLLVTSNVGNMVQNALVFNYASLLGEGNAADNSGAMLIRLLKRVGVAKFFLAGFDGFDVNSAMNYALTSQTKAMDYDTVMYKNNAISKQLRMALGEVQYEIVTPTKYDI